MIAVRPRVSWALRRLQQVEILAGSRRGLVCSGREG